MAGLDRGDIGLAEGGQLADAKLTFVEVEQCIDDTAVEMDVLVECIAEPMDEAGDTGLPDAHAESPEEELTVRIERIVNSV